MALQIGYNNIITQKISNKHVEIKVNDDDDNLIKIIFYSIQIDLLILNKINCSPFKCQKFE